MNKFNVGDLVQHRASKEVGVVAHVYGVDSLTESGESYCVSWGSENITDASEICLQAYVEPKGYSELDYFLQDKMPPDSYTGNKQ